MQGASTEECPEAGEGQGHQLCPLAQLPVAAAVFCPCFPGSEATYLNVCLHKRFSLDITFIGGLKSSKQGQ